MSAFFEDHGFLGPDDQTATYFAANLPIRYTTVPPVEFQAEIALSDALNEARAEVGDPRNTRPETLAIAATLAIEEEWATQPTLFPPPYNPGPRDVLPPSQPEHNPHDPYNNGLI